ALPISKNNSFEVQVFAEFFSVVVESPSQSESSVFGLDKYINAVHYIAFGVVGFKGIAFYNIGIGMVVFNTVVIYNERQGASGDFPVYFYHYLTFGEY